MSNTMHNNTGSTDRTSAFSNEPKYNSTILYTGMLLLLNSIAYAIIIIILLLLLLSLLAISYNLLFIQQLTAADGGGGGIQSAAKLKGIEVLDLVNQARVPLAEIPVYI